MVSMDRLTQAARAAIEGAPGSLRSLARMAGVSHVLLIKIRDGKQRATPTVAAALAQALEQWATACFDAAGKLHRALYRRTRTR